MTPTISVIICNYNYGIFISQAIQSVLCQTFYDVELIIVDDGSTDNSVNIINSVKDDRIVKVFQKNQGQAAAFNAGFEKCSGNLVAFLDSDDFWFPDKLEKTIPHFKKNNISLVQHNLTVVDKNSHKQGRSHPGIKSGVENVLEAYTKDNHTGFFSATSGIICKKCYLEKIFPLNPEWKICADVALTRPMPLFGNILTCEKDLGAYRIHDSNNWMATERQTNNWIENQLRYCDYTNHWLKRYGHKKEIDFLKSKLFSRKNSPIYRIINRLSSRLKSYST